VTATEERLFAIWVTAHYPDIDHAVTDEEMAARSAEHRGEYRAVCKAEFLPAPDDRPPGQRCPACALIWLRATLPTVEERLGRPHSQARHLRAGWFARWRRAVP
jgi:hypothetical protein